jgi:hypothetical protein
MSTVSVYNRDLLVDMVTSDHTINMEESKLSMASQESSRSKKRNVPNRFKSRSSHSYSPDKSSSKTSIEDLKKSRLITQRSMMLEDVEKEITRRKKEAEERIKAVREKNEARFVRNWHECTAGEGHRLHEEWGKKLKLFEKEKHLKTSRLHNEWNDKVYAPMDAKIKASVQKMRESGSHEVRQREYQNFLDTVNRKGGLFLDEVDEAEYNPYIPNQHVPCVKMSIDDPTLKVFTKAKEEMSLVPGLGDAPSHLAKSARYMLEVTKWGTGKIESTPHGHFAKMLDHDEKGKELPKNAATSRTLKPGYVNHYQVPKGKAVMDKEWRAVNGKGVGMNARPADTLRIV